MTITNNAITSNTINLEAARSIASEWHGGGWSHLYGFASTGIITDRESLVHEVVTCLRELKQYTWESKQSQRRLTSDLQHLLRYIEVSGKAKQLHSELEHLQALWASDNLPDDVYLQLVANTIKSIQHS